MYKLQGHDFSRAEYNVLRGRSAVSLEMALRFEKAFGGGADMWLRMQAAYDLAQARKHHRRMDVPRLAELSA